LLFLADERRIMCSECRKRTWSCSVVAWETVNRRDASGFDYLDPDIQIEVSSEIAPDAGTYRGHEGYRAMLRQWFEAWEDVRYEPTEFIDGGDDLVIVVANMHMRARKTGLEMDSLPQFYVYTVRDGNHSAQTGARPRSGLPTRGGGEWIGRCRNAR
jgi:ketosteroid isomerase-like protein